MKPGPYSSEFHLLRADERTPQARLLKRVREELSAYLGGNLTVPQRVLVERAAMLQLRCAMLDDRILDGTFTEYDAKTFLAWNNSLTRTLRALGLTKDNPRRDRETKIMRHHHQSLDDILAEMREAAE
jgi:hypothetical protein